MFNISLPMDILIFICYANKMEIIIAGISDRYYS